MKSPDTLSHLLSCKEQRFQSTIAIPYCSIFNVATPPTIFSATCTLLKLKSCRQTRPEKSTSVNNKLWHGVTTTVSSMAVLEGTLFTVSIIKTRILNFKI
uniref:Uncharacterized protein n=1 Tax=Salix viminalis TaxID=40686 RepID=A0A6N2M9U1_SALVM